MKEENKESDLVLSQNKKSDLTIYKRAFEFSFEENVDLAIRQHRGEIIPNTVRRQMKYAAKHHRNEFIETLLEVGYLIDQYFPSDKDYMNDQRIEIFIDCLTEDYADLYLEDVYIAFKKNLRQIKMYGSIQINELLKCLEMYRGQKNRLSFAERDNQHKKVTNDKPFLLTTPEVVNSYNEIYKRFDSRKEEEKEKEAKRLAELEKSKNEARKYFEHFNDPKEQI